MDLNRVLSLRRLRLIGIVLLCDAAVFVGALLILMVWRFDNVEWMNPILFLCIIPLGLGGLFSIIHLFTSAADEGYKSQWWGRLLFSGPFGPGWYLASLNDDST